MLMLDANCLTNSWEANQAIQNLNSRQHHEHDADEYTKRADDIDNQALADGPATAGASAAAYDC
jgi:hypothetical protein